MRCVHVTSCVRVAKSKYTGKGTGSKSNWRANGNLPTRWNAMQTKTQALAAGSQFAHLLTADVNSNADTCDSCS